MLLQSIKVVLILATWCAIFPVTIIIAIVGLPAYFINYCIKKSTAASASSMADRAEDYILIMLFAPIYWMKKLADFDLSKPMGASQGEYSQLPPSRTPSEKDVELQAIAMMAGD